MPKANIIIRKGAAHWDVLVREPTTGEFKQLRDFRKMTSRERSDFHRNLMNAYRENVN